MNSAQKNEIIKHLYDLKSQVNECNQIDVEELIQLEQVCFSDQQLSSIYGYICAQYIIHFNLDPCKIWFSSEISFLEYILEFLSIGYFNKDWYEFVITQLTTQESQFIHQLCCDILRIIIINFTTDSIGNEIYDTLLRQENQSYHSLECLYQCIKRNNNLIVENDYEIINVIVQALSIELSPSKIYVINKILNLFDNQEIEQLDQLVSYLFDGFLSIQNDDVESAEFYDVRIACENCISTLISSFYKSHGELFVDFLNQNLDTDDQHIFELCLVILQTLVLGESNLRELSLEIVFSVDVYLDRIRASLLWILHSLLLSHSCFPDEELPFEEIMNFVILNFSPKFIIICCEVLILLLDHIYYLDLLESIMEAFPISDCIEETSVIRLIYQIAKRAPIEDFLLFAELELETSKIFYILKGLIQTKYSEEISEYFYEIKSYIDQFDPNFDSISLIYSLYTKSEIDFDPAFLLDHFRAGDDLFVDSLRLLADAAERGIFNDFSVVHRAIEISSNYEELSCSFALLGAIAQDNDIETNEIINLLDISYNKFSRSEDVSIEIASCIINLLENPNQPNSDEITKYAIDLVNSQPHVGVFKELIDTIHTLYPDF